MHGGVVRRNASSNNPSELPGFAEPALIGPLDAADMSIDELPQTRTALGRPHHPTVLRVGAPDRTMTATVEIVVPVFNEAPGLERSIRRLHDYVTDHLPISATITIADNASTDQTWPIACALAGELDGVEAVHLEQKGRGRALRAVWCASRSPVVAYMDVDLSTDLDAILPLVAPLISGHSDLAIGTRLAPAARVVRGPKREAISRAYNLILRTALRTGFSDAQCGFKAVRTEVARQLLPLVEDEGWFFDTELLVLAEANGLRIHEVPVDWTDDPDSRVDVVTTATDDLRGVLRMVRRLARGDGRVSGDRFADLARAPDGVGGQLVRFGSIGMVSTIAFVCLFAILRPSLGLVGADLVALVLCAVANTAANRRVTFPVRGRPTHRRSSSATVGLVALPLVLNLSVLGIVAALGWTSTVAVLVALTAANLAASTTRFVTLRRLIEGGVVR